MAVGLPDVGSVAPADHGPLCVEHHSLVCLTGMSCRYPWYCVYDDLSACAGS